MRCKRKQVLLRIAAGVIGWGLLLPGNGLSQAPYYQGKTITILRGGGPGGSGELQSSDLLPYLKKYSPGNPTIVMEFMDGAGVSKASNYLY
ncbi:MAG: hypothetical protein ACREQK_20060, partial [Candidatus Binatia bacterium]